MCILCNNFKLKPTKIHKNTKQCNCHYRTVLIYSEDLESLASFIIDELR